MQGCLGDLENLKTLENRYSDLENLENSHLVADEWPSGKGVRLPTLDIVQRKFDPSGAKKINVSDSCYFNCSDTLKAE